MPVFINEVTTEIPQSVVAETEAHPMTDQTPLSQPELELLKTLQIIEERRERLTFD